MSKKRMDVNWRREITKEDLKPAVKRYKRYLDSPSVDDFANFRDQLHDRKLSRSTIERYLEDLFEAELVCRQQITAPGMPWGYWCEGQMRQKVLSKYRMQEK
jgi:hypothetical protein